MPSSNISLKHLTRQPRSDQPGKPPVVILLHGWGSNEADLMGLAEFIDDSYFVISLRAPLEMGPNAFGWFILTGAPGRIDFDDADAHAARDLVVQVIDEIIDAYGVDPARVILMGFSQGAMLSLGVAINRPDKIRCAVTMSGHLPPSFAADARPNEELYGLSILTTHGLWDQIIPIAQGREVRDYLDGKLADFTYNEYPMGHEVSRESMSLVKDWLIRHKEN